MQKSPNNTIETFLKAVERRVMAIAFAYKEQQMEDDKSREIRLLEEKLKSPRNNNSIVVPTDKTGCFRTMDVEEYVRQMTNHLLVNGKEVSRAKVVAAHSQAEAFILSKEALLSTGEMSYLTQTVASKAIPTPKLYNRQYPYDHRISIVKQYFCTSGLSFHPRNNTEHRDRSPKALLRRASVASPHDGR